MTTYFNAEEWNVVEALAKAKGISRYKLLKDAVMAYCEVCQKEKKQDEPRTEGKQLREIDEAVGDSRQSVGELDRKSEEDKRFTLPEAANHADPLDIGL